MKFPATHDQIEQAPDLVDMMGYIEISDELVEQIVAGRELVPVWNKDAELDDLTFVCRVQDSNTLYEIAQRIGDPDITGAAFGTETGDYEPLYVRYDYPSFRSGGQWFRVEWE